MFAKLFGEDDDQVLVKLDRTEDGNPEVRVYFEAEEFGIGICSIASSWEDDSDASWDKAETAFASLDEQKARGMVDGAMEAIGLSAIKAMRAAAGAAGESAP